MRRSGALSTAPLDLSAFDSARRDLPRVALPDPLRRERSTRLVAVVGCVLAALVGVMLLVLGLQGWNRLTFLLVSAGVVGVPTGVVTLWQVSRSAAARISRFADDNGWTFDALKASPGHAGSTFRMGTRQERRMVVTGEVHGYPVELGNLRYYVTPYRALPVLPGYVAVRLPARLPHVVMTSRSVLRLRVGFHPRPEDRLELGPDTALRVYARAETAHVVRGMLTADALGVLTRLSHRYCIEIVGDAMFLHARWPVSTGSGRRWRRTFADVAALCDLLDASPVWSVLRRQPRRALSSLPRLRSGFDEARVRKLTLLSFGALMVVVTLVVVATWPW